MLTVASNTMTISKRTMRKKNPNYIDSSSALTFVICKTVFVNKKTKAKNKSILMAIFWLSLCTTNSLYFILWQLIISFPCYGPLGIFAFPCTIGYLFSSCLSWKKQWQSSKVVILVFVWPSLTQRNVTVLSIECLDVNVCPREGQTHTYRSALKYLCVISVHLDALARP